MTQQRTVLLTGATSGIGRQAAIALASRGFYIVCVGRNEDKAKSLVEQLGRDRASYLLGDLSLLTEVARVAREFSRQHGRLDVLFNNAGALFFERQLTAEGLERTFALNHMSYFVMTILLVNLLKASAPARVVSTSSAAHDRGDVGCLNDLQTTRWGSRGFGAYACSKLANIWFTRELGRQLLGTGVTASCFHPGFVASEFARNNGVLAKVAMTLSRPFQRSVEQGADTGVWLATSADVEGQSGGYWRDRKLDKGSRAARDAEAPTRLWHESERIAERVLGGGWQSMAQTAGG